MKYVTKRHNRSSEDQTETDGAHASGQQVDPAEVAAMLEDIECCLAENAAPVVEEAPKDDETLVAEAFAELQVRWYEGDISTFDMKAEGTILKARFAHTTYIQQQACCHCGCLWND